MVLRKFSYYKRLRYYNLQTTTLYPEKAGLEDYPAFLMIFVSIRQSIEVYSCDNDLYLAEVFIGRAIHQVTPAE